MVILGLILLLVGVVVPIPILSTIGLILIVVGIVLLLAPNVTGGRRFY